MERVSACVLAEGRSETGASDGCFRLLLSSVPAEPRCVLALRTPAVFIVSTPQLPPNHTNLIPLCVISMGSRDGINAPGRRASRRPNRPLFRWIRWPHQVSDRVEDDLELRIVLLLESSEL